LKQDVKFNIVEKDRLITVLARGSLVWFIIITVEAIHGVFRVFMIEPLIGDLRARQVSVFLGSILILAIAFIFVRWIKGNTSMDFLAVGIIWVGLTVGFEIVLGRFALGLSWERIASDYDPASGGLMIFGLVVMLLAPLVTAKTADEI
jgi:hypothetical protein